MNILITGVVIAGFIAFFIAFPVTLYFIIPLFIIGGLLQLD